MSGPTNEEVLSMINDALDRYNDQVVNPLHAGLDGIRASSATISQDTAYLKAQMSSLYGNGSGRIGAIERMNQKLDGISIQVAESKGKEVGIEKTREKYHEFLYWLGGGAAVVAFTFVSRWLEHVKW